MLPAWEVENSPRFVLSCAKKGPKLDVLHLAESLEEDHRASDLAVCAKFRSQVVAQLFQKVFGEQGFGGARSIAWSSLQPRRNSTLESPACVPAR